MHLLGLHLAVGGCLTPQDPSISSSAALCPQVQVSRSRGSSRLRNLLPNVASPGMGQLQWSLRTGDVITFTSLLEPLASRVIPRYSLNHVADVKVTGYLKVSFFLFSFGCAHGLVLSFQKFPSCPIQLILIPQLLGTTMPNPPSKARDGTCVLTDASRVC